MSKPSPLMSNQRNKYFQLLFENRNTKGREFKAFKNAKGENEILLYDVIVSSKEEAEWWGGVDPETFRDQLFAFNGEDVKLRINSPGGAVFAGRAMQAAIREYPGNVDAYVDGIAASAASFIPQGCRNLYMNEGAMMMIHKGWTFAFGNADDFTEMAEMLTKIDNSIVKTYAKYNRAGLNEQKILDYMTAETWFTDDEAVKNGFADALPDDTENGPKDAQNSAAIAWNLNVFKNQVARPDDVKDEIEENEPEGDFVSDEHRDRQLQRLNLVNLTAVAQ